MDIFSDSVKKRISFNKRNYTEQQVLHICFGISQDFVRPIGVAMTSIMENNINKNIVYHIFIDGIIDSDINKINKFADKYKVNVFIYIIDNTVFDGLNSSVFTVAAYYRFIAINELARLTDKCLYIDADICCVGDLSDYEQFDFAGNIAYVVEDHKIDKATDTQNMSGTRHFNSGMMYINLQKWQAERISERCIELLRKRSHESRFFDQNALNIILVDRVVYLDKKYNYMCDLSRKIFKNIENVPEDTVFIHCVGHNKPWHLWCFYPLVKYFRKYSSLSEWRDVIWDKEPTSYRQMRMFARYYINKNNWYRALYWLWESMINKYKNDH